LPKPGVTGKIFDISLRSAGHVAGENRVSVEHNMQLGVQPALGSPDTTENIPIFLCRLAAVLFASKLVASIIMRSSRGPVPTILAE
jgi:hypothetical protein